MPHPSEIPTVIVNFEHDLGYIDTLSKEAEAYGWRIFNVASSRGKIPKAIKPSGALLFTGPKDPVNIQMKQSKVPTVVTALDQSLPNYKGSSVMINSMNSGEIAAKFFAERGFSHLAYLTGKHAAETGKHISRQFLDYGKRLGCQTHRFQFTSMQDSGLSNQEEYFDFQGQEISEWLKTLPKPVGLFIYGDVQASRFSSYFLEEGLKVPEDVAILTLGYRDHLCKTAAVPLSSIRMPWDKVLKKAVEYLQHLMTGVEKEGEKFLIELDYINERESTEIFAVDDPLVKEALTYIRDHYERNIGVEDFVQHSGISRSTLHRAFSRCHKKGFNEEVRLKRMEKAKHLLINSDLSVTKIAERVGFNTLNYFHKIFLRELNCTPTEYRKAHQI